MQPPFPYRSEQRALQTIEAVRIIRSNSPAIAEACASAGTGQVVLAVVSPGLSFEGAHALLLTQLYAEVTSLEPGSWHLVFSPGITTEEVARRCDETKELAALKLRAMRRWLSRKA